MNCPLLGALRLEMRPISTYLLLLLLLLANRIDARVQPITLSRI